MLSRMLSCALLVALTSCGGSPPATEGDASPAAGAARPTVFDPLTSTIDRAQSVQQTVDDQAAELRKRLEAAER